MRLYAAFDLHSSNSYLGISDEKGKRIFKKKLPNDPATIKETLKPFKADIEGIVVESTYNWYFLVDLLKEEGYRVHLANVMKTQQYAGLKYSDDKHDAFWLTEMLRLNILPEGYIYPKVWFSSCSSGYRLREETYKLENVCFQSNFAVPNRGAYQRSSASCSPHRCESFLVCKMHEQAMVFPYL